jgi:Protein of unknown function (DUF3761)
MSRSRPLNDSCDVWGDHVGAGGQPNAFQPGPLPGHVGVVMFRDMIIQRRSICGVLLVGIIALSPGRLLARGAAHAPVTCRDGSSSEGGQGACSHHRGVAQGAPVAPPKAQRTPSAAIPPSTTAAGGTVRCKDGSSSPHAGRGACSSHGGMAEATANEDYTAPVTPPAAARRMPPTPAPNLAPAPTGPGGKPTARCQDGSMSFSSHHSGSCSHHGGVARWLDGAP